MKKNNIIILSLLIFLTLGIVLFNYANQLTSLIAEAVAPNPGHSWSELECTNDLCVTSTGVGIGTASPTAKLHVAGNIIASDPTAANHVATKDYVDGKSIPSGMIAMFDASCPTGWTRVSALDGRYPRGASTYGGTGTDGNHAHHYKVNELGVPVQITANIPYINVIWCRKN